MVIPRTGRQLYGARTSCSRTASEPSCPSTGTAGPHLADHAARDGRPSHGRKSGTFCRRTYWSSAKNAAPVHAHPGKVLSGDGFIATAIAVGKLSAVQPTIGAELTSLRVLSPASRERDGPEVGNRPPALVANSRLFFHGLTFRSIVYVRRKRSPADGPYRQGPGPARSKCIPAPAAGLRCNCKAATTRRT